MKWLKRSVPLAMMVWSACSTPTTTTIINSLEPTITQFSPDTVWTFQSDTIHGTNFGYDPFAIRVMFDTALAQIDFLDDTIMIVTVPEYAKTGYIHVRAYEQTVSSPRPVVVKYTFYLHTISDTVPDGSSFSLQGTGLTNYHGALHLSVNSITFPIDSIFPNRIVSHVVPGGYSGTIYLYDSGGYYYPGSLTVMRPSKWNTLSEIYDNLTITETHQFSGYRNGPAHSFDSTWTTKVTYSGQFDTNIAGSSFERMAQALMLNFYRAPYNVSTPWLDITWDTVHQTAQVTFQKVTYLPSEYHTVDTSWYCYGSNLPAQLPVDGAIEFALPSFRYQITEDSSDAQGLVNWQETTSATVTSGSFDLILKQ